MKTSEIETVETVTADTIRKQQAQIEAYDADTQYATVDSGWRYTAKALEANPTAITIPAASFAPARTDTTNLIAYIGETISQVLVVYEADGTTPLNLSGKTLTVVFEDMEQSDTGVVASASVTVSGDNNNIVTFAYPSAVTDEIGQFRYALRDEAAPKTVYSQGLLLAKAAANKD